MKLDPTKKLAGILVPVFALRHEQDLGIGDTTAMMQAIDFCAKLKIGVLQILPVNETGGDNSPYSAISSVALDPVLLTVLPGHVPGLTQADFDELAKPDVLSQLRENTVKYARVKSLKLELLRKSFANFQASILQKETDEAKAFRQFCKDNESWLPLYTLFRTLVDENGGNACWTQWKEEQRDYKAALKLATTEKRYQDDQNFWAFVQFVAWTQWGKVRKYADENKVALMGDIPFGISRYSADVWAHTELFDLDWSGGAPPERFFKADPFTKKWGQNWGIPYYNWANNEKENYRWWRQRVDYTCKLFNYYRIDHVLGFFRIYCFPWIPELNGEFMGLTEKEAAERCGGRVPQFLARPDEPEENALMNRDFGEKVLKVLMEASGDAGIVAEDLGMVPDYVVPLEKKLGIAGFTIPIFERNKDTQEYFVKEDLNPLSLATFGTHDHPPIHSFYNGLLDWWHGADGDKGWLEIQQLMRFLGRDTEHPPEEFTEELLISFIKTLLESPCWLTVMMITDLLGTTQRFNEPGLAADGNWTQRMAEPIGQYESDPAYANKIKAFASLIKETNRVPASSVKAVAGKS
jgi:4-alpha-glucanotransferase